MRDIGTVDSELRLVAVLRRVAREIDVAGALLDERRELTRRRKPQHRDTTSVSLK
jgi:hypothetical protein